MFDNSKPMVAYTDFNWWFHFNGFDNYLVESTSDGSIIGTYNPRSGSLVYESAIAASRGDTPEAEAELRSEIVSDFNMFKDGRPEYVVSNMYTVPDDRNSDQAIYEACLLGVALIRARRNGLVNPDEASEKLQPCIEWLRKSGFYQAPASSRYHESFVGGLCYHTLKVVRCILDLLHTDKFAAVHIEDAVLVALIHDWCKIGQYEQYMRNVKNDETGVWEKVPAFRRKDAVIPLGHGVTSMFLARKFFKLSTEECLAIRWHMGRWRVCDSEMDELQHANEIVPLVHMLQFADQLAITNY